jgi:hypothetical protein
MLTKYSYNRRNAKLRRLRILRRKRRRLFDELIVLLLMLENNNDDDGDVHNDEYLDYIHIRDRRIPRSSLDVSR